MPAYEHEDTQLYHGDSRRLPLEDASVDVCVTSPPYFGLRVYADLPPSIWGGDDGCEHEWGEPVVGKSQSGSLEGSTLMGAPPGRERRPEWSSVACTRCGAWRGHLGNEPTVEMYLAHLIDVFREVRRTLKPTGSLFVNLGDSYSGSWGNYSGGNRGNGSQRAITNGSQAGSRAYDNMTDYRPPQSYLEQGSLMLIPSRFALGMQQNGWLVRAENVWAKPAPMPESIDGWRWERCRVKVAGAKRGEEGHKVATGRPQADHDGRDFDKATYEDCPGCEKCEPNGGYVLRQGSWRTTRAHEVVYHFTKAMQYYGDRLQAAEQSQTFGERHEGRSGGRDGYPTKRGFDHREVNPTRNPRSVWEIGPEPSSYAHYAAYPRELVTKAIHGTAPERVCVSCGAPWARMVESKPMVTKASPNREEALSDGSGNGRRDTRGTMTGAPEARSLGWRPTCSCDAAWQPGVVLDPFAGTGTTLIAAQEYGLRAVGIEYSETYVKMAIERLRGSVMPLALAMSPPEVSR